MIGVLAVLLGGCDDAAEAPSGVGEAGSGAGSSLDWTVEPALYTVQTCEDLAVGFRGAAAGWSDLELERARRHAEDLGVALPPQPEATTTPNTELFVRGRASQRRDQVTIHDGALVAMTATGLTFVTTLPEQSAEQSAGVGDSDTADTIDIEELSSLITNGQPWTLHVAKSDGRLWALSRGDTAGQDWVSLAKVDTDRVGQGGAPRVVAEERIDGHLRLASRHDGGWLLVTEGDLRLDGVAGWPQDLSPHADATQRSTAFQGLAQQNKAAIAAKQLSDLVPAALATDCAGGMFPALFSGAGWTLVTNILDSGERTQRLIVGRYTSMSTDGLQLLLAASNWPYYWLVEQDGPVETAVHRLQTPTPTAGADSGSVSARLLGAPVPSSANFHGDHVLMATTQGDAFVGANFKPQGLTRLTSLNATMTTVATIDDAGGGKPVRRVVHGEGYAVVVPEAATAPLRLFTADTTGRLKLGGTLASLSTWDSVVPLGAQRLLVVGRPAEAGATMAVRIAAYDVADPAQPVLLGQQSVAKGNASEVNVDAAGVAQWSAGPSGSGIIGVPVQVTEYSDTTGYWEFEPRLTVFELLTDGTLNGLGEVSHGPLAKRDLVPLTCGENATDRRITGGAVSDGVLYSVSTLGVLAHDLDALDGSPLGDALLSAAATCPTTTE